VTHMIQRLAVAALAFAALPAAAAEPQEWLGFSATERTIEDEIEVSDSVTVILRSSSGIYFSTDPSLPFNKSNFECTASFHVPANDPEGRGYGQCVGIDLDGNLWWIAYEGGRNSGTWHFLGGTGRYDGITGAGTWTAIPATGPRKFVTTWEGEWSLAGRSGQ
jgi:hypothetical protein